MLNFKMMYKLGWYIIKSSEKHFELNRIWSPCQLSSHAREPSFNNAIDLVFSNH